MSETTPSDLLDFIARLCELAGDCHLAHWRKLDKYEKKGAKDLVTEADEAAEAAVASAIRHRFPQDRILAEEGGEIGAEASAGGRLWIVDPLDGTTNFAHGLPLFSVSVGVQRDGETVAGGIFAPALGEMYLAGRGLGATRNGQRIGVSKVDTLEDSLLVTGFPYDRDRHIDWLMGTYGRFLLKTQGVVRLGSAALDLANVAAGHLDGFYELNLKPWDCCAGALLVEEAGGRMSNFENESFDPFIPRLVASNGRIHAAMVDVLGKEPCGG
ncbi:MAG: inositol monophosphatase family protein [Sumerlaeia bacterium]